MRNKLGQLIANMDAFGAPIQLNFRGKTNFQTKRGGLISIIIYSLTFWQIWIQATKLYTQEDPNISTWETSYLADTPVTLPEMN